MYTCVVDIGSSSVHVAIARINEVLNEYHSFDPSTIEILGVGSSASNGVKAGSLINLDIVSKSVSEALNEAELMSGVKLQEATVNITGKHLRSENSTGIVAVADQNKIVSVQDVMRAIEGSQNIRLSRDQEIIHILSQQFRVDNEAGIKDPIGMTGMRLEADVHIVSANLTALNNVTKVMNSVGLQLRGGVMNSLASAEALLSEEEKEIGTLVLDIGEGVTDVIAYSEGGVFFSSVIPYGGGHVTQDISLALKIPLEFAEMLKKQEGSALLARIDPLEKIEIPGNFKKDSRWVLRQALVEIIDARLREIFELVHKQLSDASIQPLLGGSIAICGGMALLEGIDDLAEDVFGQSATVLSPSGLSGFGEKLYSPEYATLVGMLFYENKNTAPPNTTEANRNSIGLLRRVQTWLTENF